MPRPPLLVLVGLALAVSACDTTIGTVPDLDRLTERYGTLPQGTFRLYDAALDSTFAGGAAYSPADPGVTLRTADFSENDTTSGVFVFIESAGLGAAKVGDQLDVFVAYDTFEGQYASLSLDAKAEVTATDAVSVSGVFYARVRSNATLGIGGTHVVEGGFNAARSETGLAGR